jgi:hypothetical protein
MTERLKTFYQQKIVPHYETNLLINTRFHALKKDINRGLEMLLKMQSSKN